MMCKVCGGAIDSANSAYDFLMPDGIIHFLHIACFRAGVIWAAQQAHAAQHAPAVTETDEPPVLPAMAEAVQWTPGRKFL